MRKASTTQRARKGDAAIRQALSVMEQRIASGPFLGSPQAVKDYLRLKIGTKPHEVFMVLFIDAQNHLIAAEEMFRGTLTQTSVYPREVVKAALSHNAASVVFAHNHPSGVAEPSPADELLTQALKAALKLVDIRTLDHFVVCESTAYSFVEHNKLQDTPDETKPPQKAEEKPHQFKFDASASGLYVLNKDASKTHRLDQLTARLSQVGAMLSLIHGNGFENFSTYCNDVQDEYLWACASLVNECKELAGLISLADLKQ